MIFVVFVDGQLKYYICSDFPEESAAFVFKVTEY